MRSGNCYDAGFIAAIIFEIIIIFYNQFNLLINSVQLTWLTKLKFGVRSPIYPHHAHHMCVELQSTDAGEGMMMMHAHASKVVLI